MLGLKVIQTAPVLATDPPSQPPNTITSPPKDPENADIIFPPPRSKTPAARRHSSQGLVPPEIQSQLQNGFGLGTDWNQLERDTIMGKSYQKYGQHYGPRPKNVNDWGVIMAEQYNRINGLTQLQKVPDNGINRDAATQSHKEYHNYLIATKANQQQIQEGKNEIPAAWSVPLFGNINMTWVLVIGAGLAIIGYAYYTQTKQAIQQVETVVNSFNS